MAGDWIKVEEVTPDKPEIAVLARKLGVSQGDAFLEWFRVYRWAGRSVSVESRPGFVPILSPAEIDMLSGARPGTAAALASDEIGWLSCHGGNGGGVTFAKWDRHNSKSAKARALDAEKKRRQRDIQSPQCPDANGTETGLDERRARGELRSSKGDRKSIGIADAESGDTQSAARSHSPRSPVDASSEGRQEEPFDLSDVDWSRVESWAVAVGRKIPPRTTDDRRMWFKFAVMADMSFGECWLADAVEAVLQAKETRSTRQAHLVGVLKAKASEDHGVNEATFLAMLGRIEIPKDVWKSGVLEVRK